MFQLLGGDFTGRADFNDKAVGILKAVIVAVGLVMVLGLVQVKALVGFGAEVSQVLNHGSFAGVLVLPGGQLNHAIGAVADFGGGVIPFDFPANRLFVDESLVELQRIDSGQNLGDGVDLLLRSSWVKRESGPKPGAVAKVIAQIAGDPHFNAGHIDVAVMARNDV